MAQRCHKCHPYVFDIQKNCELWGDTHTLSFRSWILHCALTSPNLASRVVPTQVMIAIPYGCQCKSDIPACRDYDDSILRPISLAPTRSLGTWKTTEESSILRGLYGWHCNHLSESGPRLKQTSDPGLGVEIAGLEKVSLLPPPKVSNWVDGRCRYGADF